jgi:TonB-linked SusC/RagA family outer membrane protein
MKRCLLVLFVFLPLAYPAVALGQGSGLHLREGGQPQRSELANPLQRPVTLDAVAVPLADALTEISAQANLGLVYGSDLIPADRQVTLRVHQAPAGTALRRVLADTDLDFSVTPDMQVVLVRRPPARAAVRAPVQTGTLMGQVTDALTGEGVAAVDIWLDGTARRTITSPDGRYLLTNVAPGQYQLRARRIGYATASQAVTVLADQTLTVDFALQNAPTQLDAIVATVTGEQRVREMGHVVGQIRADSLVREAPVSNLAELLNGRVPGLQVFQTSGTVGGQVSMRIRSTTSVNLSAEPIVIVDGIRYTSGSVTGGGHFNVEPTSRLNDINPNDIESVEVVKGPSAATLYGTDAANGVIVITTKRGRAGPAQWNVYARAGITEIPEYKYDDSYWGWGWSGSSSCSLYFQSQGFCSQDSVTVIPNPLNNSRNTILSSSPRWEYGANVSGGKEDLRYYFSADFEEAAGPVQLPAYMVTELRERLGGGKALESQLEPNRFDKLNLRANITAGLGENATIQLNMGYTQNSTRQLAAANPFVAAFGVSPTGDPYGSTDPIAAFAKSSLEDVNRFSASANAQWQPLSWLHTRAVLGMDLPTTQRYSLEMRDERQNGTVSEDRARAHVTSGELGATASFRRNNVSSRTSVGAQYVRSYSNVLRTTGRNLRPGGSSVIDATTISVAHAFSERVTLGTYLEQVVGFNDRVFLTGAVRADGASTFGNDYKAAFYPKAGVSWVVSEEPFMPRVTGLDDLRLRYAFGASGQQPLPEMGRLTFASGQGILEGGTQNKVALSRLPSPGLRPEKVKEHEFGLDASAFEGRLRLDLSWNYRKTVDQLHAVALPAGLGTLWTNFGISTGQGVEALVTGRIIEAPALSWDLTLSHATNSTKIVDLGGVPSEYNVNGSLVEGFPIAARFMRPIVSYEDANGNGIIEPGEVVMGDSAVYVGRISPGNTQVLTSVLGLFDQRVRISALLDRRSDFMQVNMLAQRNRNTSRAGVDPTSPLGDQAKEIAKWLGGPPVPGQSGTGYFELEDADLLRLREVGVTVDLPSRWAQAARLSRAMLSVSGRNLALWSRSYSGPDPESSTVNMSTTKPYQGGIADNLPQARTWVVRVDLGF